MLVALVSNQPFDVDMERRAQQLTSALDSLRKQDWTLGSLSARRDFADPVTAIRGSAMSSQANDLNLTTHKSDHYQVLLLITLFGSLSDFTDDPTCEIEHGFLVSHPSMSGYLKYRTNMNQ